MNDNAGLAAAELASLDLLITVAQLRGRGLDDRVTKNEEQAQAQMDHAVAMYDARHGGLEFSQRDREILRQIGELASELEVAPTLGQLIEMRGEAVRSQG